jgi:hypothetical protein
VEGIRYLARKFVEGSETVERGWGLGDIESEDTLGMLLDEPQGWSRLQAMAQRERDPKRLVEIINQMICVLDEREGRPARRSTRESDRSSSDSPDE